jgi:hypothetical protein
MDKVYVVSIDEEFEKSRTKGAKDKKKRKVSTSEAADIFARAEERIKKDPTWLVNSGRQEVDTGYKKWGDKYLDHVLKNYANPKDSFKRGMYERAKEIKSNA